ncbi:MAG: class III signal peptide-containing protein [Candidatus Omnitrophota bacterium]
MRKKGQSTVEYILLVTAVVTVAILITGKNSVFQNRLGNTINITTNGMQTMAHNLTAIMGSP